MNEEPVEVVTLSSDDESECTTPKNAKADDSEGRTSDNDYEFVQLASSSNVLKEDRNERPVSEIVTAFQLAAEKHKTSTSVVGKGLKTTHIQN